jgi:hypothetical protein
VLIGDYSKVSRVKFSTFSKAGLFCHYAYWAIFQVTGTKSQHIATHHLAIAPSVPDDQTKSNPKICKVILAIVVITSIYILVILPCSSGANWRLFKSFMGQVSCFATMHVGPFSKSRGQKVMRHLAVAPWVPEDRTKSNPKICKVILAIVFCFPICFFRTLPDSAKANMVQPKGFSGHVFNFKLGCFALMLVMHGVRKRPHLVL